MRNADLKAQAPRRRDGAGVPLSGEVGASGPRFTRSKYNTAANPFACTSYAKQSVSDRYTGREFIVPNELLSKLDAPQVVDFPPLNSSAACEGAGGTWYVETGRPAGSPQCYFTVETRSVYDFLTEGYGFWD